MTKIVFFAFRGDLMCLVHILLNAMDMKAKGYDVRIVIEGEATGLIPALSDSSNPMNGLYKKTRAQGLIEGACRACSRKMGVADAIKGEGLELLDDMNGHPGMVRYLAEGFQVITL